MPKDRFVLRDVQGLTPAIDARQADGVAFVLSGRNYLLDSRGPRAAFASQVVNNYNRITNDPNGANVQALAGFIFTTEQVLLLTADSQGNGIFTEVFKFPNRVQTEHAWRRWTHAFVSNTHYFCHPAFGIYRRELSGPWTLIDPGISQPQAICESNSRLIVLGVSAVAYSEAGQPESFTPTLGGAGFQILSELIAGTPYVLFAIQTGYLVMTPSGGIIGEFIGGDLVFRHYSIEFNYRPISSLAYIEMEDGSYLFCTNQGIYNLTKDGNNPTVATPVFNEFLRNLFKMLPRSGFNVRLNYDSDDDLLYLQIRDQSVYFNKTYVLAVAIDKWGEFSISHRGIIQHRVELQGVRKQTGYVDMQGFAHQFLPYGTHREQPNRQLRGLDSEVVIGPLRAPTLLPFHDTEQELQGFALSHMARPSWHDKFVVRLDDAEGDEVIDEGAFDVDTEIIEENDAFLNLPDYTYKVSILSDASGMDPGVNLYWGSVEIDESGALEVTPALAREYAGACYWDVLIPGVWHRMRVRATEPGEYFHVTSGEFTFSYAGRLNT